MGMRPTPPKRWTVEDVRALADAAPTHWPRYELIDGELLVTPAPAPRHQRLVLGIVALVQPYVRAHGLGRVYTAPADIGLVPESVVQPDAFVVPRGHGDRAARWRDVSTLLLAVEVLSPGSERTDRVHKRRYYQRSDVPEYWIVDGEARIVERWRPADTFRPEVLDETLVWHPAGATEPLAVDLAALFAEAADEET